jgi:dihydromonapterin reductase/dihydrofolate reductase
LISVGGDTPTDIIHFTDYVADTGSAKHIAYSASKAAMANMSLSFAKRFAPTIKVNSIAPALLQFNPDDSLGYRDKALTKSLLMKEGGLSEAVDTVNYILNSGYITGRTLHLDGGRHLR